MIITLLHNYYKLKDHSMIRSGIFPVRPLIIAYRSYRLQSNFRHSPEMKLQAGFLCFIFYRRNSMAPRNILNQADACDKILSSKVGRKIG